MKRLSLFFPLVLTMLVLSSCGRRVVIGRGEMTSDERSPGPFTMIDIEAPITADIHIKPGAPASIQLSGYENLLEQIQTTVAGNTLKIYTSDHTNLDTDKEILADITVPSLSDLRIQGSGDAKVYGSVTGDEFKLKISGAGNVWVEKVELDHLAATISGVGDVEVAGGSATSAEYTISGAGNMNSFAVNAADVVAKVSGTGQIDVFASKSLEAKVSGAGSIKYKGHPQLHSKTSGIGSVVAAD